MRSSSLSSTPPPPPSSSVVTGPVSFGVSQENGGNTCSGGCFDQSQIQYQYLASYFGAHMLSKPSYRYVYLLWFITILICLVLGLAHMTGLGDNTYIGAVWKRWATKNRVYKVGKRVDIHGNKIVKSNSLQRNDNNPPFHPASSSHDAPQFGPPKKRKVFTFPSFGRVVLLFFMLAVPITLSLVGADYIGPNVGVFNFAQSWPSQISSGTPGLSRRAYQRLYKGVQWGLGSYPSVTTLAPTITLPYRTWWTIGNRTGDITMALCPIVLVMALKQVPFALLSIKIFGGYAFDRLSFLHKWGGRIIWLFATVHLATWTVQLNLDSFQGQKVWSLAFRWAKFRWGWVSYGFLTLMVLTSFRPIRNRFYEWFYIVHITTVIGFMVSAWLHHPPLGMWMYLSLAWWAGDRLSRALKVAWVNGLGFAGRKPQFSLTPKVASAPSFPGSLTMESEFGGPYYNDTASRGHSTVVGSASSHKNNSIYSSGCSQYESTLVHGQATRFLNQNLSNDPYAAHYGISAQSDPHTFGPTEAQIDRRKTKLSARYDPVNDLISDYLSKEAPEAAEFLQSPTSPQERVTKYGLNDNGPVPLDLRLYPGEFAELPLSSHASSQPPTPAFGSAIPMSRSGGGISSSSSRIRPAMSTEVAAVIRPGYAFVQLLPGKTLRLTLRTPNKMSWKPGQWVYLNVPSVRCWESHPFTIASAYDADLPSSTQVAGSDEEKAISTKVKGEERTLVFLIRCRQGFTRRLWNHVVRQRQEQIDAAAGAQYGTAAAAGAEFGMVGGNSSHGPTNPVIGKGTTGVHLRAIIDGPYGSVKRTHWGIHSTVVIVCGGSGISFGMAVLEHLCACIAQKAQFGSRGKGGKDFQVQRIRFVWIMREFAHLQWVASALRRCIEMVPPEQLQVDLYVTHFNHKSTIPATNRNRASTAGSQDFYPPNRSFTENSYGSRQSVAMSTMLSTDQTPRAARFTEGPEQDEYEITANDLTHFDGEDESAPTSAEVEMSKRIRSEGKLRRARTRKMSIRRAVREGKPSNAVDGETQALESQRAIYEGHLSRPRIVPSQHQQQQQPLFRPPPGVGTNDRSEQDIGENSWRSNGGGNESSRQPAMMMGQLPKPRNRPPFSSATARPDVDVYVAPHLRHLHGTDPTVVDVASRTNYHLDGSLESSVTMSRDPTLAMVGQEGICPSPFSFQETGSPHLNYMTAESSFSKYHRSPSTLHLIPKRESPHKLPSSISTSSSSSSIATLGLGVRLPQPPLPPCSPIEEDPIDLDDQEDLDLRVIAELARPGHPKLDRILATEIENSKGKNLIAGCGPTSLDVVLGSIVSKQILPQRAWKGDLRGQITLVSECFEWGG